METINKQANELRRKHGKEFEKYVDTELVKSGLACKKTYIDTSDGEKISDHTFGNVWMESTTYFNKGRANEFILKKKLIEEATTQFTKFYLFYEREITKNTQALAEKLINAGWILIAGKSQIDAFITSFGQRRAFSTNYIIRVADPKLISVDLLIPNPLNREEIAKGVEAIAKSIVNEGFLTCLYVVPQKNKNGKITGYMLFEGHHRLSAVKMVRSWGFSLDNLPCVVVDWLSTDDMEKLSKLLIKINVEYRTWKLRDYIKHHLDIAKILNIKDKIYSYQTLLDWMKVGKDNGFGDNGLIYILGPLTGTDKWLDRELIQNGDYIVTVNEVEKYATPFFDVMKKYREAAKKKNEFRNDVYQTFCCELYEKFKDNKISLKECIHNFAAYNMLEPEQVPNKKTDVKNIWVDLDEYIQLQINAFA
jgi:hypothetical protein